MTHLSTIAAVFTRLQGTPTPASRRRLNHLIVVNTVLALITVAISIAIGVAIAPEPSSEEFRIVIHQYYNA